MGQGRRTELTLWLGDAEINRDRNLRLQYLAGMELNSFESESIFEAIVACRGYPEDLFLFSGEPDDGAFVAWRRT